MIHELTGGLLRKVENVILYVLCFCVLWVNVNQVKMAVFTLGDKQIVWMKKSSQTDKLSDVKTG